MSFLKNDAQLKKKKKGNRKSLLKKKFKPSIKEKEKNS